MRITFSVIILSLYRVGGCHNLVIVNPDADAWMDGHHKHECIKAIGFTLENPADLLAPDIIKTPLVSDLENAFGAFEEDGSRDGHRLSAHAKLWTVSNSDFTYISKVRSMKAGGLGESVIIGSGLAENYLTRGSKDPVSFCQLKAANVDGGERHPQGFYERLGFRERSHKPGACSCWSCKGIPFPLHGAGVAMRFYGDVEPGRITNWHRNRVWQRQEVSISPESLHDVIERHWGSGYGMCESFRVDRWRYYGEKKEEVVDTLCLCVVVRKVQNKNVLSRLVDMIRGSHKREGSLSDMPVD